MSGHTGQPEKDQAHDGLRQAAESALLWGQRNGIAVHIFAAPYKTKVGRFSSRGSCEATARSCPGPACKHKCSCRPDTNPLSPWDKRNAFNPCIRLDYSGLTAIDVDKGLEGLNDEQLLVRAEENGLSRTLVIRSGRDGGCTFVYRGLRDNLITRVSRNKQGDKIKTYGFQTKDLAGDILCHGHIAAPGSLHANGKTYRTIWDHIVPLPEFWVNYRTKKLEPKPDLLSVAIASGDEHGQQMLAYAAKLEADILAGKKTLIPEGQLIPKGKRWEFLKKKAGQLRKAQHEPEMIRAELALLVVRKCEDGLTYLRERSAQLDLLAKWSAEWGEGDYATTTFVFPDNTKVTQNAPLTRTQRQAKAIAGLSWRIRANEVHEAVRKALVGTTYTFNPQSGKQAQQFYKEMQTQGYAPFRDNDGVTWWVNPAKAAAPDTSDPEGQSLDPIPCNPLATKKPPRTPKGSSSERSEADSP